MNTEEKQEMTIGQRLDSCALAAAEAFGMSGNFERTIAIGQAMNSLRDALTNGVMTAICKLQNTKIGFRTDNPNGYEPNIVRDCVIEASIHGLQCVGNHFNIIAGNFYVTKEGLTYLLRHLPGLSDLKIKHRPAEIRENSTSGRSREGREYTKIEREGLVVSELSYTWHGKKCTETLEHVIRVNNGMSQDAILGKAERKVKAWLYNLLKDSNIETEPEVDMSAGDVVDVKEVSAPAAADIFAGDGLPGVDLQLEG